MSDTLPANSPTDEHIDGQWHRLSPIAILYFIESTIRAVVGNIAYLIPALLVAYSSIRERPLLWLSILAVVLLILAVSASLMFFFFRYRLRADSIEVRSGVLAKKQLNLPFSRVQNVKLEQPIYYRPFDFVCLIFDTAGSSEQEAKLVALPQTEAIRLKEVILSHKDKQTTVTDTASAVAQSEEQLLVTRSIKDLVIHGLTSNRIYIFLGILAPFMEQIGGHINNFFAALGIDLQALLSVESQGWLQVGLYIFSLLILAILIMSLFSVIGAIITFYGFSLSRRQQTYVRRSGLFTRHEVSMGLSRLQMIVRKQDWLDRVIKRINLTFEQVNAQSEAANPAAAHNRILVPSINPAQSALLVADAWPGVALDAVDFAPISRRIMLRYSITASLPALLFVLIGWASNLPLSGFLLLLPYGVFAATIVYRRWKCWGVAVDDEHVYLRKGVFGFDVYCSKLAKVQQIRYRQSVLMARHQLASVDIKLASRTLSLPFLPEQQALTIYNLCLFKVESARQSWM